MTLIESALQKMQQSNRSKAANPINPTRRRVESAVLESAAVLAPRVWKPSAVNLDAMERYCVLPQVKDDTAQRAYKILRTRVLQRMAVGSWRSLVVTGTEVAQGKTLTAMNLAFALAQDPQSSVFLVDLDLRRPQIANYLGLRFEQGISDYFNGTAGVEDIIYESGTPRLSIIPNGSAVLHSSEMLASPRMAELNNFLREQAPSRYIIYDMPPLLMADDVMVFAPMADAVLLVITEGMSDRGAVQNSKELLGELNLLGTVLNRSAENNDAGYY